MDAIIIMASFAAVVPASVSPGGNPGWIYGTVAVVVASWYGAAYLARRHH
ncbi:hypothetical protein [Azospirillum sp. ST 5-10]